MNTAFRGFGPLSPNSKQKQHERALVASRTPPAGASTQLHGSSQGHTQLPGGRKGMLALRGRLIRSPRRRTVLGVAGPASAHLISHRRFQASTGGGAPDSPTGAAVKQPAASALAIGAGFAQQQQQLSTRAGFKQQHLISTRAGFWVSAAKHRAASAFLLRRGGLFFSSAAGKKNLGFSGLASRPKKETES